MSDEWYYVQNGERKGPVSFIRLKAMAANGWLAPDDLVWRAGMADWKPAKLAGGLFGTPIAAVLTRTIAGLRETDARVSPDATPPSIPETKAPSPQKVRHRITPEIEWDEWALRHVIAACGGFLAALGIAFTAIAQSRLALAFTLSGLCIAAAGFSVEVGKLLRQSIENIGKASKEAAERRLRAKELALEKQRLDVEAARLAQDQAARSVRSLPATTVANQHAEHVPTGPADTGHVVVINQPPVQRWSPGLAAVLSFLVPGLGQLYKGQIVNGIVWFLLIGMGYVALILPGLVLHFFCVLGALSGNPWTEGKTTVVRN